MLADSLTIIFTSLPLLTQGALMTLQLWLTAVVISICFGTFWGILRSTPLRINWISQAMDSITFILRGIPFYVQLLIFYFVLPELTGINLSAMAAGTFSLGLCSGAYLSQIIKGGINSISISQWEAAAALGFTKKDTVRHIILPQTLKAIIPSCTGELDQLLKSTSMISTIGVLELTGAAKNIISREMNPLTMYLTIAVVYLALSSLLNLFSTTLERRISQ